MKKSRTIHPLILTVMVAQPLSCTFSEAEDPPVEVEEGRASLKAGSCENLDAQLKTRLIEDMDARLEYQLDEALYIANNGCNDWWWEEEEEEEEEEEAGEYTTTNVQVNDVDEADFVKNDGGYVYILADGHFWVLDAWPADETHTLSTFEIKGEPKRMYVHGDKAIIYSTIGGYWANNPDADCTYGYDCDFTGDGEPMRITILDISDRTNPVLTRELEFDSAYLNSRRVGMDIHTALVSSEYSINNIEGLDYWPDELPSTWEWCNSPEEYDYTAAEVYALFDEMRAENLAKIENTPTLDLLPKVTDKRYEGDDVEITEAPLSSCKDFYISEVSDARGFLSLMSFAIDEVEPMAATTLLSRPGAIYADADSLYVAVRHRRPYSDPDWFPEIAEDIDDATSIHKFRLKKGGKQAKYLASGVVKGRVLNQFAMDERDNVLRIATTSGHAWQSNVHSTITTLEKQGKQLVEVGQLDNLAPTEDIRSVRFRDEIGYVVTFKKTDPLFVIDLADPATPTVLGELKIPGFSTYMHPMDEEHLLTMGYDADDQGTFAWFQGIQLQIIDTTDLEDPALLHKEVIGTRGSTSEAATNHLAFTYFKARDLLAVPMTVCEEGGAGDYGDLMTFSGLLVYDVTVDGGFEALGGVPHDEPETLETWSNKCYNWWTNSNSRVKRSIFMEDWVYSIARDQIKVANIEDLENPPVSISLVTE